MRYAVLGDSAKAPLPTGHMVSVITVCMALGMLSMQESCCWEGQREGPAWGEAMRCLSRNQQSIYSGHTASFIVVSVSGLKAVSTENVIAWCLYS